MLKLLLLTFYYIYIYKIYNKTKKNLKKQYLWKTLGY
jgi:hypothetical protein